MAKKKHRTEREFLEDALGVVFHEQNPSKRKRFKKAPTEKQEIKAIKMAKLRDRVRAMRPYFGELFKAKGGFHLGHIDDWTRNQQKKVDKYWQVMAPLVSRPHKARYYKRPDHLNAAIVYSQQEALLKGQKAALFDMNRDEVLKVRFDSSGQIQVRRGGVSVRKVYFDPIELISDPISTVSDAVDELEGAKRFKLIMGPHESRGYFKTKNSLLEGIAAIQGQYSDDEYEAGDEHSHFFGNWLFGLIGYYGAKSEIDEGLEADRLARESNVLDRNKERYNKRINRRARMLRARQGF